MLSTISQAFGDWQRQTPNTTPDAPLLQKLLARAVAGGATAAVIEVSAHGVLLDRILGCRFDGLLFTNLSPDHLDTFDGMEAYFAEKRRLFVDPVYHKADCRAAIGTSDEYGKRLLESCPLPGLGFGWQDSSDGGISAGGLAPTAQGIRGELSIDDHKIEVDLPLTSEFNCLNITGAAVLSSLVGLAPEGISRGLTTPLAVPGRLMEVPATGHPFRVIVDFAHTGAAMENLLTGLRRECQGRLIVVFGAGGDRDRGRRHGLTSAVFEHADVGVITLDNPRSEQPQAIIDSMRETWLKLAGGYNDSAVLHVEPDRAGAIECAIGEARMGDIVVLAGKGHETGQIFADRVEPHDDFAVASEILGRSSPD
jgi:UDP-N-acetylmuramoyl-L-alanyl-D-glutamate--2,6-diaminopimelate ligase